MQRVKSILKRNIILYNQFLSRNKIKLDNFNISSFSETNDTYFISNNNNKYYCLIINGTSKQMNNNILYFFSKDGYTQFSIKISCIIQDSLLLEGYLYQYENTVFNITDVLVMNNRVQSQDYTSRRQLIESIFHDNILSNLVNLNNYIDIKIHPVQQSKYIDIDINLDTCMYIECIKNHSKTNKEHVKKECNSIIDKLIKKTKFSDVYNVYDITTNNHQGILYIKTREESIYLYNLFLKEDSIILSCMLNDIIMRYYVVNTSV